MRVALSMLVILGWAGRSTAENIFEVSEAKKRIPKIISPKLQQVLSPTSFSVLSGGKEIAHVWVRSVIPTSATKPVIPYFEIEEGMFLGVLELGGKQIHDFRDQELVDGVYTIRFVMLPEDGDHLGAAPYPEFVCLLRAEQDQKLDSIGHDDLLDLAVETLETGHPAILFLQTLGANSGVQFPSIGENEHGHVVLNLRTGATLADGKEVKMPLGLIIIGVSDAQ